MTKRTREENDVTPPPQKRREIELSTGSIIIRPSRSENAELGNQSLPSEALPSSIAEKEAQLLRREAELEKKASELGQRERELEEREKKVKERELAVAEEKEALKEKKPGPAPQNDGCAILAYREYLQFFLLRELDKALNKPLIVFDEKDRKYFEFVTCLEDGLAKLNEFSSNPIRTPVNGVVSRKAVLTKEYNMVLVFTAILYYKDKPNHASWIDGFIDAFTNYIFSIPKKREVYNTFKSLCERIRDEHLTGQHIGSIKAVPDIPTLIEYSVDRKEGYPIPDKDILLEKKSKFPKRGKDETFISVFEKKYHKENFNPSELQNSNFPFNSPHLSQQVPPAGAGAGPASKPLLPPISQFLHLGFHQPPSVHTTMSPARLGLPPLGFYQPLPSVHATMPPAKLGPPPLGFYRPLPSANITMPLARLGSPPPFNK